MGLLNSARECVRPSLLVFLFSDPPYPAGVVVIIVVIVVWTPPVSGPSAPSAVNDKRPKRSRSAIYAMLH